MVDISFEPLPLVIGVTGHRDLREANIPLFRKELHAIFERLEDDYANPPPFLERMRRRLPGALLDKVRELLPVEARKRPGATPMIVLSALAEGADQLVAQVAIERGLRVIAPLPLPEKEYRRDFELQAVRPDALEKFNDLKAGIETFFVGYENGNSPDNVSDIGEPRNLQYQRVGTFIARHCDVLIALWDGKGGTATGGTAEIVNFKLNGIPLHAGGSARACLDAPEMGPVIHIVTPRVAKTETADAVAVKCWGDELVKRYEPLAKKYDALEKQHDGLKKRYDKLMKQYHAGDAAAKRLSATAAEKEKLSAEVKKLKAQMAPINADYLLWKSFEATIRLSREFNHTATRFHASLQGRTDSGRSFSYLFEIDENRPETKAAALQGRTVAPRYCDLYAVADALAIHWQRKIWRDWFWLFAFGLTAFGCFEAYSHLAPIARHYDMPGSQNFDLALLSGYLLSFAAVVVLYLCATRGGHQERFLDYRALAEALRVAVFWRFAGIDGAADVYPIKLPRELAWVKTCLLGQELFDNVAPAGDAARTSLDGTSYAWIRHIWIRGQLDYFERTRHRHKGYAGTREGWSSWILWAVAALALLLLGLVFFDVIDRGDMVHELFLFVIGFLPGFAAVLVGYCEKLAFNAQARQYERMAELFRRAYNILPPQFAPANADLVRAVVRELGTEAMRDNAEWVSTYRERPFSLPQS